MLAILIYQESCNLVILFEHFPNKEKDNQYLTWNQKSKTQTMKFVAGLGIKVSREHLVATKGRTTNIVGVHSPSPNLKFLFLYNI